MMGARVEQCLFMLWSLFHNRYNSSCNKYQAVTFRDRSKSFFRWTRQKKTVLSTLQQIPTYQWILLYTFDPAQVGNQSLTSLFTKLYRIHKSIFYDSANKTNIIYWQNLASSRCVLGRKHRCMEAAHVCKEWI